MQQLKNYKIKAIHKSLAQKLKHQPKKKNQWDEEK